MGIDDKVGSLKPGKRADLIAINDRRAQHGAWSPIRRISCSKRPSPENVDTVVVDGRILKRGGKLTALDPPKVVADARAALAGVRERTKWR